MFSTIRVLLINAHALTPTHVHAHTHAPAHVQSHKCFVDALKKLTSFENIFSSDNWLLLQRFDKETYCFHVNCITSYICINLDHQMGRGTFLYLYLGVLTTCFTCK